jgi:hypothetical protein
MAMANPAFILASYFTAALFRLELNEPQVVIGDQQSSPPVPAIVLGILEIGASEGVF